MYWMWYLSPSLLSLSSSLISMFVLLDVGGGGEENGSKHCQTFNKLADVHIKCGITFSPHSLTALPPSFPPSLPPSPLSLTHFCALLHVRGAYTLHTGKSNAIVNMFSCWAQMSSCWYSTSLFPLSFPPCFPSPSLLTPSSLPSPPLPSLCLFSTHLPPLSYPPFSPSPSLLPPPLPPLLPPSLLPFPRYTLQWWRWKFQWSSAYHAWAHQPVGWVWPTGECQSPHGHQQVCDVNVMLVMKVSRVNWKEKRSSIFPCLGPGRVLLKLDCISSWPIIGVSKWVMFKV